MKTKSNTSGIGNRKFPKKFILYIICMLLINSAFALDSTTPSDYLIYETGDITVNGSTTASDGDPLTSFGWNQTVYSGSENMDYTDRSSSEGALSIRAGGDNVITRYIAHKSENFTCDMQYLRNSTIAGCGAHLMLTETTDFNGVSWGVRQGGSQEFYSGYDWRNGNNDIVGNISITNNTFVKLQFQIINKTGGVGEYNAYVNGVSAWTHVSSWNPNALGIYAEGNDLCWDQIDEIRCWNTSSLTPPQVEVLPGVPVLVSPFNTTPSTQNQTLTWLADSEALNYTVYHSFNQTNATDIVCETTGLTCLANATSGEGDYYWRVQANNNLGSTSSVSRFWTYDITNVLITLTDPLSDNSTVTKDTQDLQITFDNVNLDTAIVNVTQPSGTLIYNNVTTGISNTTFVVTSALILTENGVHTIRAYGNDSVGLFTERQYTFNNDLKPPSFDDPNNNWVFEDSTVTFDTNISDNAAISDYIFSWDDSGVFVNDSAVAFSSNPVTTFKTITASNNTLVCGKYYANDTFNNVNESSTSCFTFITPTPPPPPPSTANSIFGIALPLLALFGFIFVMKNLTNNR